MFFFFISLSKQILFLFQHHFFLNQHFQEGLPSVIVFLLSFHEYLLLSTCIIYKEGKTGISTLIAISKSYMDNVKIINAQD